MTTLDTAFCSTRGLHWTRRTGSVRISVVIGAAPVSSNVGPQLGNWPGVY